MLIDLNTNEIPTLVQYFTRRQINSSYQLYTSCERKSAISWEQSKRNFIHTGVNLPFSVLLFRPLTPSANFKSFLPSMNRCPLIQSTLNEIIFPYSPPQPPPSLSLLSLRSPSLSHTQSCDHIVSDNLVMHYTCSIDSRWWLVTGVVGWIPL